MTALITDDVRRDLPAGDARHGRAVLAWVGLLAFAVVVPNHAQAYRTFADDPEVGYPATHDTRAIVWNLAFVGIDTGDLAQIEGAAIDAVDAWADPACTEVQGDFRGSSSGHATAGDGRNTIEFVGMGWGDRGFDANRGAVTDVSLRETEDGWMIAEADIYVDFDTHHWTVEGASDGALDLRAVLTHEWGHLLGFDHPHEGDEAAMSSAMFPTYIGLEQRALSSDDVDGVCALYPRTVVACDPACGDGQDCLAGRCVDRCPAGDCTPSCEGRDCDVMCAASDDCAEPRVCGAAGDDHGWCIAARSFGAPCAEAEDCASSLCLTSMSNGAFCTSSCVTGRDCPSDQTCQSIDARNVCAPRLDSSSCSAGHQRPAPLGLSLVLLALLFSRLRRKFS